MSRTITTTVTIPLNIEAGGYTLGAMADVDKAIAETNESNNTKASNNMINIARYAATQYTVTDKKTRLVWQKSDDDSKRSWSDAVSYCDQLVLGGKSDWRLPRIDELRTLIDYTRFLPAIDPSFQGHTNADYWTITELTTPIPMGYKWIVDFQSGSDGWLAETSANYVRCVRNGPFWPLDPSENLVMLDEDRVKDNRTKLTWQRADDGTGRTWQESVQYCNDLELGGAKDWRLPAITELESIIDYTEYQPAFDPLVFEGSASTYWSATSSGVDGAHNAWAVDYFYGQIPGFYPKTGKFKVRCVRGAIW